MKNIIILIILQIMTFNSYGTCISDNDYLSENTLRPDTDTHYYSLPKNMIYLEFLGSTQERFSLNYERTLYSIKKNYFSLRTGINRNNFQTDYNLLIPLSINYQNRISKAVLFEIGFGPVYWHRIMYRRTGIYNYNLLYYNTNVGFRFIIGERLFVRPNCYFLYIKEFNSGIEIWPGFSLGVAF